MVEPWESSAGGQARRIEGPRTDHPRTNADPAEIARKRALLHEPRMDPLTVWVDGLRAERDGDMSIPYFDPTEGGIAARIALLLEAPSERAAYGSGFISPDNDDVTAENMWGLLRDAELDRALVVTWNVVPWYIGNDTATQEVRVPPI